MYAVILAGGGGTRLWPLSTPARPKPFLPLLADGATLFQRTIRRLTEGDQLGLHPAADLYVIVEGRFADLALRQLHELQPDVSPDHVLAEPVGRNTTAAIALGTTAIGRADDEVMVVLPADHLIGTVPSHEGLFRAFLVDAELELACRFQGVPDALVTLGVQPTRPAIEYGYLRPDLDRRAVGHLTGYALRAFVEKPDAKRAAELLREPGTSWNAGMFLWRRRAIRRALETYPKAAPIWREVSAGWRTGELAVAYERLRERAISIDYAVLEPAALAGQVVMGSLDVPWSDLGGWSALLEAVGAPGVGGRVVPAGETVDLGPDDLLVRRDAWPESGPFAIEAGPGRMGPFATPTAHLAGAATDRTVKVLEALLERVTRQEN